MTPPTQDTGLLAALTQGASAIDAVNGQGSPRAALLRSLRERLEVCNYEPLGRGWSALTIWLSENL